MNVSQTPLLPRWKTSRLLLWAFASPRSAGVSRLTLVLAWGNQDTMSTGQPIRESLSLETAPPAKTGDPPVIWPSKACDGFQA